MFMLREVRIIQYRSVFDVILYIRQSARRDGSPHVVNYIGRNLTRIRRRQPRQQSRLPGPLCQQDDRDRDERQRESKP